MRLRAPIQVTMAKLTSTARTAMMATVAFAFVLAPALRGDNTAKASKANDEAATSVAAPNADETNRGDATRNLEATPDASARVTTNAEPSTKSWAAEPAPAFPEKAHPGSRYAQSDSVTPRVELFLGYSYLRNVPSDDGSRIAWLHGGSTSVALNVNQHFGLVADFAGFHADRFGPFAPPSGGVVDASGNVFTLMVGPRLSFRRDRITPFGQALFGGAHAGEVKISGCTGISCFPLPEETAFAMTAGVGLDLTLQRHLALRLFQAEYLMTRFSDRTSPSLQTARQNDIRLSAGLVFRFGGEARIVAPPRPVVATCSVEKSMVYAGSGDVVNVRVEASDPDNNPLTYSWTGSDGPVEGTSATVRWNSTGMAVGEHSLKAHVDNGRGERTECSAEIRVEAQPNRAPEMTCSANRNSVTVGEPLEITATASDPDNDALTYAWSAGAGQNASRLDGSGAFVRMPTAGMAPGNYTVTGRVDDGRGGTADCTVVVAVQAAAPPPEVAQLETRLALHSIYFPTARPTAKNPEGGLLESQQQVLTSLASDFKRYVTYKPEAHLILGGHADVRGTEEYNKALTERRVERTKRFLVEHGVAAGSIEVRAYGKEDALTAAQVKEQMQANPELSPEDRQKMLRNLQVIVLANNRRVDVTLSTTGQQSVRRYPFNARDALALISASGTGHETVAHKKRKKQ